jgi:[acyl-carrier-protein] S-malonyltransferase
MAGHSLGEYSALVCADAIDFADAVRLVQRRGRFMQDAVAVGEGAMAAVLGLDDADVAACCREAGGVVSAANFNAPGQVVIAGAGTAVDAAIERCKAKGAKRAIRLAVSVPSHCALMRPAAEKFAAALESTPIRTPRIPVVQNVDGAVSKTPDELRARLVRQLSEPVLWTRCVAAMAELGVRRFVECGPGRVLAGLIKRIDRGAASAGLCDPTGFAEALNGPAAP